MNSAQNHLIFLELSGLTALEQQDPFQVLLGCYKLESIDDTVITARACCC